MVATRSNIYLNIVITFIVFIFPTTSYGEYSSFNKRSSHSNAPIILFVDSNGQNLGNSRLLSKAESTKYDKPSNDVNTLLENLLSYRSLSNSRNQHKSSVNKNRNDNNQNYKNVHDRYNENRESDNRNIRNHKNNYERGFNNINRYQYRSDDSNYRNNRYIDRNDDNNRNNRNIFRLYRNDYKSNKYDDRNNRNNDKRGDKIYNNNNYRNYGTYNRNDNDNYKYHNDNRNGRNYKISGNSRFQDRSDRNLNRNRNDRKHDGNDRFNNNYENNDRSDRYVSQNNDYSNQDRDNGYNRIVNIRYRDDDRYNRLDNEDDNVSLVKSLLRVSNNSRSKDPCEESGGDSCEEKVVTDDPCEDNNSCGNESDGNISTRGIPSDYVSEMPPNCCK